METSKPGEQHDNAPDHQLDANYEHNATKVNPVTTSEPTPTPFEPDKSRKSWYDPFPWWKFFEGVGILFGILYAIVTICMWRDAHNNFIVDQRAWVSITSFRLEKEPTEDATDITIKFSLVDSGKTPAVNCIFERQPSLLTAPRNEFPKTWALRPKDQPVFVLMPGAEQGKTYPWKPDASHIPLYKAKRYMLYVQVKVWYDDVFGGHHWATTCRSHEFESGKALDDFGFCPTGTEIDTN
jgi:hypothetical protein